MKSNTGQDNIQVISNISNHMEEVAEVKVKGIRVAAVTKDNSEVTIIMAIMTAAEAIVISIMEEAADRMVVEEDLVPATTVEAQRTSNTSEEVEAVVVDEEMVGTTRRDTSIIAAETITTPKIRNRIETTRTHWTSFTSCE